MVMAFARRSCSSLQCESQPSRFTRFPSSHCSCPARTPSPQSMFWQFESQVVPLGGSHCSPGSTAPLPHKFARHCPCRHTLPPPQVVPFASGMRAEHMCVESLHVEAAWHGSDGAQLRVLSVETQTKWHDESHPCEPSLTPSSHSSEPLTMPSPQTGAWHAPSRQILPPPQSAPAASAPDTVQRKSTPQIPVPLHGSCGSQCALPRAGSLGTQLSVQSRSQPAVGPFCSPLSPSSGVQGAQNGPNA